jgi:hypothetical protein
MACRCHLDAYPGPRPTRLFRVTPRVGRQLTAPETETRPYRVLEGLFDFPGAARGRCRSVETGRPSIGIHHRAASRLCARAPFISCQRRSAATFPSRRPGALVVSSLEVFGTGAAGSALGDSSRFFPSGPDVGSSRPCSGRPAGSSRNPYPAESGGQGRRRPLRFRAHRARSGPGRHTHPRLFPRHIPAAA